MNQLEVTHYYKVKGEEEEIAAVLFMEPEYVGMFIDILIRNGASKFEVRRPVDWMASLKFGWKPTLEEKK